MFKNYLRNNAAVVAAFLFAVCCAIVTLFLSPLFALVELVIIILFAVITIFSTIISRRHAKKFINKITDKFDYTDEKVLKAFPFPAVVCTDDGSIKWCNSRFVNRVVDSKETINGNISAFTNGIDLFDIVNSEESSVLLNNRSYKILSNTFEDDGVNYNVLYYIDNTEFRNLEKKYSLSRPWVILAKADNIGDNRLDFRDSERAEIKSMIESEIEKWSSEYNCIMKRLSDTRYIIITEKKEIDRMIESKFTILDTIRELRYKNTRLSSSISLGVADGDDLVQCESRARKAIEMALGRGGDQAAVTLNGSYTFFGGVLKSVQNSEIGKIRVVGTAFSELIEGSDEVIVMGHRWPDLDAIGAALGVCCACEAKGVPAFIATDKSKTLCQSLVDRILGDENQSVSIIDESTAINIIDKKTLLVIVDTHIKSYVEFPEVYKKAKTVFVIDHHRKSVDFIDNSVVFYHDPAASSTCEMVTELLAYIEPTPVLTKLVSEALLSGIMLDTKNFVLRSGVRTFQAAAFLKKNDADTVSVKKLFASSIDNYKLKNDIIASCEQFCGCAISVADVKSDNIRIVCSMAADEMLDISGVKASFVVYRLSNQINISARSLGEVNVQVIMESLGGGGHQTMAAAQIECDDINAVVSRLKKTIELDA